MKKLLTILMIMFSMVLYSGVADANGILYPTDDWAFSDDGGGLRYGDSENLICQRDLWEAFFTFDLSGLSDSDPFPYKTFFANINVFDTMAGERTLWYGNTLIGSLELPVGGYNLYGFSIDLTALNWSGEDYITLTLTGPEDEGHLCATVKMLESCDAAYLSTEVVSTPEPTTLLLLGLGITGLAVLRKKS